MLIRAYRNRQGEFPSDKPDYFLPFDYIVGDWAYGKLRLKGFNSKTNANFKDYNDVDKIEEYLNNYCAYGCKYFILSKEQ